MLELEEIRHQIDTIDAELVTLLENRMMLVTQVAAYKKETGKAIYDKNREDAVLDKIAGLVNNKDFQPYIVDTFADVMKHSRAYQTKALDRS